MNTAATTTDLRKRAETILRATLGIGLADLAPEPLPATEAPPAEPKSRYLTEPEARLYLAGVSRWTLWRLVRDGRLPVCRVGRRVSFDVRDLDRFMAASKRRAAVAGRKGGAA